MTLVETADTQLPYLEIRTVIFGLCENQLQVLLEPTASSNHWQIPGQPIPLNQSIEDTAIQCVLQRTGLHEAYLEQLYTYGDLERASSRMVTVVYFALIPADATRALSNDLSATSWRWAPVHPLPTLIGDHADILSYALRRLRYKLEYSAVGFQLLPENFSLSQLQNTYEMILGEKLDKRNFRRRILQAGIIEPTLHLRAGEGRPARLYRYQPDAVAEVKARRLFP